jgi:aerobic carbon-monoxide dehydrogenase medium subunit
MRFFEPETLPEAVDLLSEDPDGRKLIAGGTAVVLMLQQRLIAPDALVSLARIHDLDTIQFSGDNLHIGSLAPLRDVAAASEVVRYFPALAKACAMVGNVRVRNQATLGGNLAEADYASDPPAMLLALNAVITAVGRDGERQIPLADFFHSFYTTALMSDEVIESISIPILPANTRMTYLKYKSRSSEDRPCAAVAGVASFDDRRCTDLRIAVGAACEIPRRLPVVEAMAINQILSDQLIAEIAEGYANEIETLDDLRGSAWYRSQMIRVHMRRALEELRDGRR